MFASLRTNIVFDLGGVVVRWKPDELIASVFHEAHARHVVRRGIFEHPDWVELDRGTIAWNDAVTRGAERTGQPEQKIAALLRQVPASLTLMDKTVELMRKLKNRGHRLYCLSNMHIASIEYLERTYGFWDVFSGKVISCRVGLCKPEAEIYEHLLQAHGLSPAQTLFVDDVRVNLDAAAQFGISTLHFEDAAQCERALRDLGYLL